MSKFNLYSLSVVSFSFLLPSCSHDTVLATSTSVGLSADGDVSKVIPDHISLGFRRRELVYSGKSANTDPSVLAKIDSTTSWNKGMMIQETTATGMAADLVASGGNQTGDGRSSSEDAPLSFASNTTVGLDLDMLPSAASESVKALFGYKRKIVTRVTKPKDGGRLPSTYSNVSVHSGRILGSENLPVESENLPLRDDHTLSDIVATGSDDVKTSRGGTRIRQSFALGVAAENFLKKAPKNGTVAGDAAKQLVEGNN